jgi:hypothetical protein
MTLASILVFGDLIDNIEIQELTAENSLFRPSSIPENLLWILTLNKNRSEKNAEYSTEYRFVSHSIAACLRKILKKEILRIQSFIEKEYDKGKLSLKTLMPVMCRLETHGYERFIEILNRTRHKIDLFELWSLLPHIKSILARFPELFKQLLRVDNAFKDAVTSFFLTEMDRIIKNNETRLSLVLLALSLDDPILKIRSLNRLFCAVHNAPENIRIRSDIEKITLIAENAVEETVDSVLTEKNYIFIREMIQILNKITPTDFCSFTKACVLRKAVAESEKYFEHIFEMGLDKKMISLLEDSFIINTFNVCLNHPHGADIYKLNCFLKGFVEMLSPVRAKKIYLSLCKNSWFTENFNLVSHFSSAIAVESIELFTKILDSIPDDQYYEMKNLRISTICHAAAKCSLTIPQRSLLILNNAVLKKKDWDLNNKIFQIIDTLIQISGDFPDKMKKNLFKMGIKLLDESVVCKTTNDSVVLAEKYTELLPLILEHNLTLGEEVFFKAVDMLEKIPDSGKLCILLLSLAANAKAYGLKPYNALLKRGILLIKSQFIPNESSVFSLFTRLAPRESIQSVNNISRKNMETAVNEIFQNLDPTRYEEYCRLFFKTILDNKDENLVFIQLCSALKSALELSSNMSVKIWDVLKPYLKKDHNRWQKFSLIIKEPKKYTIFLISEFIDFSFGKIPIGTLCQGITRAFSVNSLEKNRVKEILLGLYTKFINNEDFCESWLFRVNEATAIEEPEIRFVKLINLINELGSQLMAHASPMISETLQRENRISLYHLSGRDFEDLSFIKTREYIDEQLIQDFLGYHKSFYSKKAYITIWEKTLQQINMLCQPVFSSLLDQKKLAPLEPGLLYSCSSVLPFIKKDSARMKLARTISPYLSDKSGHEKTKALFLYYFSDTKLNEKMDSRMLLAGKMPENETAAVGPLRYVSELIDNPGAIIQRLTNESAVKEYLFNLETNTLVSYIEHRAARSLGFKIRELDDFMEIYTALSNSEPIKKHIENISTWKNKEYSLKALTHLIQFSRPKEKENIQLYIDSYIKILRKDSSFKFKSEWIDQLVKKLVQKDCYQYLTRPFEFKFNEIGHFKIKGMTSPKVDDLIIASLKNTIFNF